MESQQPNPNNQIAPGEAKPAAEVLSKYKIIAVISAVFITATIVTILWQNHWQRPMKGQKACTQDAKLCPDGSYVGRTGPNCEFTQCPDTTAGWQIYGNEKYGYELQYPQDWTIDNHNSDLGFEVRGGGNVMGGDTYWENYEWQPNPELGPMPEPQDHRSLYLIVYYLQNKDTIDDYFNLKDYPNDYTKLLEVKDFQSQFGASGRQYVIENLDHPVGVQTVITIFKKNDSFYVFKSPIASKEIHNQILSTFQFIK